MRGQTFTGQALIDALSAGEFDHPGIVLTGMVKPSEQEEHVAFARGGCETWVDLPTSMIEQAEHLGSRPCDDHAHPVFRLTLREAEDPQARILGQLLASQPSPALGPPGGRPFPHARRGRARALAARHPFHDTCLGICDFLVRECIGFGGDYDKCIGLRAMCSDLCGAFDPLDAIVWW